MEKMGDFLVTPEGLEVLAKRMRYSGIRAARVDIHQGKPFEGCILNINDIEFGNIALDQGFLNSTPKETVFSKMLEKTGLTLLLDKLNQALIKLSRNGICEDCASQEWGIYLPDTCRCSGYSEIKA